MLGSIVHVEKIKKRKKLLAENERPLGTTSYGGSIDNQNEENSYSHHNSSVWNVQPSFKHFLDDELSESLPSEVLSIYDQLEKSSDVQLEDIDRKKFYREFCLQLSGRSLLPADEVVALIKFKLAIDIHDDELNHLLQKKLEGTGDSERTEEFFDFARFASFVIDVLVSQNKQPVSKDSRWKISDVLPLDPESFPKQVWDVFCMLILLFCSFYVPFAIAFIDSPASHGLSSLDYLDISIDCIFMVDIALAFVTGYDSQGFLVTDLRKISQHYLHTWFIPDLAGSFPFDLVISAALDNKEASTGLGPMRLVRMLRLVRAVKFVNKMNKLKYQEGLEAYGSAIGIFNSVFVLIFTAHLLGCFFTMIAQSEPDTNWIEHFDPDMVEAENVVRYVLSLYWATVSVTTMGYGDVLPVTHNERIFTIIVALTGAVVFSYCMGNVSSLISQVAGVDDRFQETLRSVLEYMQFRGVSVDLKRKVKNYYTHCWRRSAAPYNEAQILSELPYSLRSLVLKDFGVKILKDIPLFQAYGGECVGFIASHLKPIIFGKDEVIYSHGELALDMYLLVSGSVTLQFNGKFSIAADGQTTEVSDKEGSSNMLGSLKKVKVGDSFGELALFPDLCDGSRPETAIADSQVMAYCLSRHDVDPINNRYPKVVSRLRDLAFLKSIEVQTLDLEDDRSNSLPWQNSETPCRISLSSARLFRQLLRRKEKELLCRNGNVLGSEVFNLMYLMEDPTDVSADHEMQKISCVIAENGELLYVENSLKGLSAHVPKSLGFVIPGKSQFSVHDASPTKDSERSFGCNLLVFDHENSSLPQVANANEPQPHKVAEDSGKTLQFFANKLDKLEKWSQVVKTWINPQESSCVLEFENKNLKTHSMTSTNTEIEIESNEPAHIVDHDRKINESSDYAQTSSGICTTAQPSRIAQTATMTSVDEADKNESEVVNEIDWVALRRNVRMVKRYFDKVEFMIESTSPFLESNSNPHFCLSLNRFRVDVDKLLLSSQDTLRSLVLEAETTVSNEKMANKSKPNNSRPSLRDEGEITSDSVQEISADMAEIESLRQRLDASNREMHFANLEIDRLKRNFRAALTPFQRLTEVLDLEMVLNIASAIMTAADNVVFALQEAPSSTSRHKPVDSAHKDVGNVGQLQLQEPESTLADGLFRPEVI